MHPCTYPPPHRRSKPCLLLTFVLSIILLARPTLSHPLSFYARAAAGKSIEISPGVYYEPYRTWTREPLVYRGGAKPSSVGSNGTTRDERSRGTSREVTEESVAGLENWLSILGRQSTAGIGVFTGEWKTVRGAKSVFEVLYVDGRMPAKERSVFEYSTKIWADNFESRVAIRVSVEWVSLMSDTLGEAMTPINVDGGQHAKLERNVRYGSALAAALTGQDFVAKGQTHIHMRFNSPTNWHLDVTKDAAPAEYDLATVALHELTHGLFFSGAIEAVVTSRTANYQDSTPSRFDQFITATAGGSWDKSCSSRQRFGALTEAGLRFTNAATRTNMSLYAPAIYQKGSSTYHLDDKRLRGDCRRSGIDSGDCSDLMTPQLSDGYTQRKLGETTLSVLRAMRSEAEGVPDGSCRLGSGLATPEDKDSANGLVPSQFNIPTWGVYALAAIAAIGLVAFLASVATCFKRSSSSSRSRRQREQRQDPEVVI